MSGRRWSWLGLGGLLAIALAPAGLLTATLAGQCAAQCRFAEVEGYWWRGAADIYLQSGRPDRGWSGLGRLRWQARWFGLHLTLGGGSADLAGDWAGLQLTIDQLRLPAGSLFAHVGHGLPQDGWGGDLTAGATRLTMPWNFSTASGQGEIVWRQAQTSLLENFPLGEFRLAWTLPADGHGQGRLKGDAQPVAVDGDVALMPFHFNGQVQLAPAAAPLKKYLDLIGQPAGENAYRITLPRPSSS